MAIKPIWILMMTIAVAGTSLADGIPTKTTLKLVNVVFRHGDRAPDPVEMYPRDPHYNNTFYPYGLGGLTNEGKQRLYHLGHLLRLKYNDFLGDIYTPDSVSARSTDYKRTKMCLQLVLASLYPPLNDIQQWSKKLMWQPIPTVYATPEMDWLMIPEECPGYLAERVRVERSPDVRNKIGSFAAFMDDLSKLTGKSITTPNDMYNLYHLLTAEAAMNLPLPSWTEDIFPTGRLLDGINLEYEIFSYNTLMRKLNGGKLLYRFVKEMKAVISGKMPKDRRINLFSGHETNIAAVLQTLGVYVKHVPAYSSSVITELHEINKQYYVKVIYFTGIPAEFKVQTIPGCTELCPFNTFVSLLKKVMPTKNELSCKKSKNSKPLKLRDAMLVL